MKYKSWNSQSPAFFVLSFSLSSSTANQSAAQSNYYTEPDFAVPGFVFLKLCYLYRYSKRSEEKTPDPITVEESVGEPEELGAKKFKRVLSGMFDIIF